MSAALPLQVVFASSEAMPWSHTGGLAEVAAALPAALHGTKVAGRTAELTVVVPLYRATRTWAEANHRSLQTTDVHLEFDMAGQRLAMDLLQWRQGEGPRWVFVDCPQLFDRDGLYDAPGRGGFADNPLRFAAFCRAVLWGVPHLLPGPPAILHAHDWQTSLLPLWLTTERQAPWAGCRSVFTIHNLAFQGVMDKEWAPRLGIPWHHFHRDGVEFWDRLNLLKGGIVFADAVTTVSPTYAREILAPAAGEHLDGLLRQHVGKLQGILNGIDTETWSPVTDRHIAANYSADDLSGKARCRQALLSELGLDATDRQPIFGVVARFAGQKGLDLVASCVPFLVEQGARLIVLGSGDPGLERDFAALAHQHGDHVAVRIGFDVGLAHRIEAGADAFLMPSRYEPCGLNQMFSMAYGTPPVVHGVGGLRDTVVPATRATLANGTATGFVFEHADAVGLRWAMGSAIAMFRDEPAVWAQLVQNGMRRDWSWATSAQRYAGVYERLIDGLSG